MQCNVGIEIRTKRRSGELYMTHFDVRAGWMRWSGASDYLVEISAFAHVKLSFMCSDQASV